MNKDKLYDSILLAYDHLHEAGGMQEFKKVYKQNDLLKYIWRGKQTKVAEILKKKGVTKKFLNLSLDFTLHLGINFKKYKPSSTEPLEIAELLLDAKADIHSPAPLGLRNISLVKAAVVKEQNDLMIALFLSKERR